MDDYPHFFLHDTRTELNYTSPGGGGGDHDSPPKPDRTVHSGNLLSCLEKAKKKAQQRLTQEPIREGLQFIPLVFEESSDFDVPLDQLENTSPGTRVISAKHRGDRKKYLVAVPDSEVERFAKKFKQYRDDDTRTGKPQNEPLASAIESINSGNLEDYWTEAAEPLPAEDETFWWEVWLDASDAETNTGEWFREVAAKRQLSVSKQQVTFPDRLVILARASLKEFRAFPGLLRFLAELRRANVVAGEFTSLPPAGQAEFINDLLGRTTFAAEDAPRICILDTGVNRGHPLLEDSLGEGDVHAWQEDWNADDHHGHGTEMAGVCLFGPLGDPLYGDEPVALSHRLESVKILPPEGENSPPDYGPITVGAMSVVVPEAAYVQRVFCLAVTAEGDDLWRPTLWSAHIDQAASGALDSHRRLVVVSAGNLREDVGKNYPNENYVSSVEDPAQAWNVLTVGAYTNLAWMQEEGLEGYTPIARQGTLSPASRTSMCWGDEPWPYKPDVVFEGGNYASDGSQFITISDDLQVLTTRSLADGDAPLGVTRDTSAATAQCARMAAILQSEYPDYWPETIRGLIVHSAEWTPQMLEEFPHAERRNRLRVYGMGVPNLQRARKSARGFTTMVIQDELQAYAHTSGDNKTRHMHLHDLPIPRDVLQELGNTPVRMRVTLSYFIEPNPPRRGYIARHQYASHGLRFSVRRPQESPNQMRTRLSREFWPRDSEGKAVRPPTGSTISDDRDWQLGPEMVAVRGSLHSDYWTGSAVQLAASGQVAVHPVSGWWRYRRDPEVVEQKCRYSLIVSISTDAKDVDLYEMVAEEIKARVEAATARVVTPIEG